MAPPPKTFRGPTAKSLLKIEWDYPVYTPPKQEASERSQSQQVRRALPREEALKVIAGDDPRPLLVLRECKVCNGTDDALLKGGVENEQTFLLSQWFHCVKLPSDVLEEDHPFHALFLEDKPEHLFVCSVDGSNHDPLESQTSRTELWKSMRKLLAAEYKKRPDGALKSLARLLDKMDAADQKWNDLVAKKDEILEEEGPKSKKLKKIDKDLKDVEADRKKLKDEVAKASALELKEREKPKAEEGSKAGA